MMLSIIMPALNEAATIEATLNALRVYRLRGVEIVVADGESSDGTADLARGRADRVIVAPRGRSLQMNEGAAAARHARSLATTRPNQPAARAGWGWWGPC